MPSGRARTRSSVGGAAAAAGLRVRRRPRRSTSAAEEQAAIDAWEEQQPTPPPPEGVTSSVPSTEHETARHERDDGADVATSSTAAIAQPPPTAAADATVDTHSEHARDGEYDNDTIPFSIDESVASFPLASVRSSAPPSLLSAGASSASSPPTSTPTSTPAPTGANSATAALRASAAARRKRTTSEAGLEERNANEQEHKNGDDSPREDVVRLAHVNGASSSGATAVPATPDDSRDESEAEADVGTNDLVDVDHCAICLGLVQDVASLDSCPHRFCFACIYEWTTENSSTCPLCRKPVRALTHYGEEPVDDEEVQIISSTSADGSGGAATSSPRPITVAIPQMTESQILSRIVEDEEPDTPCVGCRRSDREDRLLLCDGCDAAWHTDCVGLAEVPAGDFFCPECVAKRRRAADREERAHKRRMTQQSGDRSPERSSSPTQPRRRLIQLRELERNHAAQRSQPTRRQPCRNTSSLSSLSVRSPSPAPPAAASSAALDFASQMAARLSGWTSLPSGPSASAAARARRPQQAAIQPSAAFAQPVSPSPGGGSTAWSARQALHDLAKKRDAFMAKRQAERQRQTAAAAHDWSRRLTPPIGTAAAAGTGPALTAAASTALARQNRVALAARIAAARWSVAASSPGARAPSGPHTDSAPLRRRIPKKVEAVIMRDAPEHAPAASPRSPFSAATTAALLSTPRGTLNATSTGAGYGAIFRSPFTAPRPNSFSSPSPSAARAASSSPFAAAASSPPIRGPLATPRPHHLAVTGHSHATSTPRDRTSPIAPAASSSPSAWSSMGPSSLPRARSTSPAMRPGSGGPRPLSTGRSTGSPAPAAAASRPTGPRPLTSSLFPPRSPHPPPPVSPATAHAPLPPMPTFADFVNMLESDDVAPLPRSEEKDPDGGVRRPERRHREHVHSAIAARINTDAATNIEPRTR